MSKLIEQFALPGMADFSPRYNIAPTQMVLAVRRPAGSLSPELVPLKWGLVPSWAEDLSIGNRMINARSETAAQKPAFRTALRQRRCLIPADGFYEWKAAGKKKQPYHITLRDGELFAFAGLWERWQRGEQAVESCTILTTEANQLLRPLHDRMPVIISPDDYPRWLDPNLKQSGDVAPLLRSYDADRMRLEPVSTLVNSPANEAPGCIEPAQKELF